MTGATAGHTHKEKLITIVGGTYVEWIVPNLLKEAFESYKKKDFSGKHFQVSILENAHATSAIILTVVGVEAYRNRINYLKKRTARNRNSSVAKDLCNVLACKCTDAAFPANKLET